MKVNGMPLDSFVLPGDPRWPYGPADYERVARTMLAMLSGVPGGRPLPSVEQLKRDLRTTLKDGALVAASPPFVLWVNPLGGPLSKQAPRSD